MWGDVGRCGEMWRQAGAHHVVRLGHALDAVAEEVGVRLVGVEEERLFTARVCVKRRCSQAGLVEKGRATQGRPQHWVPLLVRGRHRSARGHPYSLTGWGGLAVGLRLLGRDAGLRTRLGQPVPLPPLGAPPSPPR